MNEIRTKFYESINTAASVLKDKTVAIREKCVAIYEFLDALGKAIDKEQENGAVVTDTAPIDTFEKLDYKAIRAEASDLWQRLVEKDPENAPVILKKVEMIFGRPMKLSEITEDQVDLFNLVVLDMRDMMND